VTGFYLVGENDAAINFRIAIVQGKFVMGFHPAFVVGQVRAPFDFAQGRLCPYENRFWLRFGGFVVAAVPIYRAAEAFFEIY
jgi:hypothetical protein